MRRGGKWAATRAPAPLVLVVREAAAGQGESTQSSRRPHLSPVSRSMTASSIFLLDASRVSIRARRASRTAASPLASS